MPWRLRFVVTDLSQELLRIGSPERHVAAQHLVEHDPKTVDVRASVDAVRFPRDLFRRHVARRPGHEAELLPARPGLVEPEAEVDEHRMLFRREDDVDWLDVAMDRPLAVGVRERIGDRGDNAGGIQPSRPVRDQPLGEARPTQKVGDDVDLPVMGADIVHGHDTGMPQPGHAAGLFEELIDFRPGDVRRPQYLDRDRTIQFSVVREIDLPETTGTDDALHVCSVRSCSALQRLGHRAVAARCIEVG